jgi:hypothetical protein
MNVARKLDAVEIFDDRTAHRRSLGGAEHRDRARLQERVELDDRSS